MSDDMSIPSPAYRMPQQRGRMDPALRRVMMYAGGLIAAGVVVGGVSMLFNRQSTGPVPVVSADPRPLRVKPENPGGMQIAGWRADRTGDGDQPGKLGPGPEAPDPSLLQAAPSTPLVEVPDAADLRTGAPDGAASRGGSPVGRAAVGRAAVGRAAVDGSAVDGSAVGPDGAASRTGSTVARSQPDAATRSITGQAQPASQTPAHEASPSPAHVPVQAAANAAPQGKAPPAPTPVVATVTTVTPRTNTVLAPPAGARPVPSPTPVASTAAQASSPRPGTLALPGGKSASQPQQVAFATPAAKTVAPAAKPVSVQLAALLTEDAAKAEWQQMERRMPEVLGGHTPSFSRFERDGRTYWRVRVSGFGDIQGAKGFCERVRAKNATCSVADF